MRTKKKGKRPKKASNKAILTSVTKEMEQPRVAKSARIENNKQINPVDRKPV